MDLLLAQIILNSAGLPGVFLYSSLSFLSQSLMFLHAGVFLFSIGLLIASIITLELLPVLNSLSSNYGVVHCQTPFIVQPYS